MSTILVIPRKSAHDSFASWVLTKRWAGTRVVTRGRVHDAFDLPGFVAVVEGSEAGIATYNVTGDSCELVTLDSLVENQGVGKALVDAVAVAARDQGCKRLWLITTNDNLRAQAFYEHRGFRLVAVHAGAIEESRRLKPEISLLGIGNVPITDEIEYELVL